MLWVFNGETLPDHCPKVNCLYFRTISVFCWYVYSTSKTPCWAFWRAMRWKLFGTCLTKQISVQSVQPFLSDSIITFWRALTRHAPCWPLTRDKTCQAQHILNGAIRWRGPLVNRMRGSKDISSSKVLWSCRAAHVWEKSRVWWGHASASRSALARNKLFTCYRTFPE